MPSYLVLSVAFVYLSLISSIPTNGYTIHHIQQMCSKTPYPNPCEYFFNKNPNYGPFDTNHDFLKASLNLALYKTMQVNENIKTLGQMHRNSLEKAAWDDCLELHEYTINRINKAAGSCNQVDAQTWLSSALTYLETCRDGLIEVGAAGNNVLPLMNSNVSLLISNALAMNKAKEKDGYYNKPKYNYDDSNKFPTWVSPGDRKLLQASNIPPGPRANLVVAQDGSGAYTTVAAAVAAAKSKSRRGRFVIYVKAGLYNENVEIKSNNIMLVGDGIGRTIITGSRSSDGGFTTYRSATVAVVGDGFICSGITIRNTAGGKSGQAVALRSSSDLSVFYQCTIEGYQDTLFTISNRQFYKECDIYGTVDFIFGNAAVVFQNCNIRPRKPPGGTNAITAQGRTDPNQNTGIVIHNSRITPAGDLTSAHGSVDTYLGRPWKEYSQTVIMKTFLDGFISPRGWLPWDGKFALKTLFYAEYANTGAGSSTANRVKWPGYHVIPAGDIDQASAYTVGSFIAGNAWLPDTNVPFTSGL